MPNDAQTLLQAGGGVIFTIFACLVALGGLLGWLLARSRKKTPAEAEPSDVDRV